MKLKLLIISIIISGLWCILFAEQVAVVDIHQVAVNWMEAQSSIDYSVKSCTVETDSLSTPLIYLLDFNPDGYLI